MPLVERDTASIAPFYAKPAPPPSQFRKVSYSTLSVEAITQLAIQDYGFSESVKCVLYQRGMNDTYCLSGPDGQCGLRVSRSNARNREMLSGELDALRYIGSKGAPVALPIARSDGDWISDIHAPEGLRNAVMFRWASGRSLKWTDTQHALHYGRSLAQLHAASEDFPENITRPRMSAEYLLHVPATLIRSRLTRLPSVAEPFTALVDRAQAGLSYAEPRLRDWGFCHGDVHPNNARIDDDQMVLFDFDYCLSGWRVYDLAAYQVEARRQGVEKIVWKPFIDGYLKVRPIAAESLEFLGVFMVLKHLWTVAECIVLCREVGFGFMPDEVFENLVPFCEKIESDTRHTEG